MPTQKLEFARKQEQSRLSAVHNSPYFGSFYLPFDLYRQYTLG